MATTLPGFTKLELESAHGTFPSAYRHRPVFPDDTRDSQQPDTIRYTVRTEILHTMHHVDLPWHPGMRLFRRRGENLSTEDVRLYPCSARTPCHQVEARTRGKSRIYTPIEREAHEHHVADQPGACRAGNSCCATERPSRNLAYARLAPRPCFPSVVPFTALQRSRHPPVCAPSFNQTTEAESRTTSRNPTTAAYPLAPTTPFTLYIYPPPSHPPRHALLPSLARDTLYSLTPSCAFRPSRIPSHSLSLARASAPRLSRSPSLSL